MVQLLCMMPPIAAIERQFNDINLHEPARALLRRLEPWQSLKHIETVLQSCCVNPHVPLFHYLWRRLGVKGIGMCKNVPVTVKSVLCKSCAASPCV